MEVPITHIEEIITPVEEVKDVPFEIALYEEEEVYENIDIDVPREYFCDEVNTNKLEEEIEVKVDKLEIIEKEEKRPKKVKVKKIVEVPII